MSTQTAATAAHSGSRRPVAAKPSMVPREHGAWGLLLQPFAAAAILAREWDWALLPALVAVFLGFLIREPLLTLARQRWIWRTQKPESRIAVRALAWEIPVLGLSWGVLAVALPLLPLMMLTAIAGAFTVLSVWMTVRNRQRSIALQAISSLGLATTAFWAALAIEGGIAVWVWPLWAVLGLHAVLAIVAVHARLEARIASRSGGGSSGSLRALGGGLLATWSLAALLGVGWQSPLALPVALSAAFVSFEAIRMRSAGVLEEPLRRVGFRMLGYSLAHMAATIAVLWPLTR